MPLFIFYLYLIYTLYNNFFKKSNRFFESVTFNEKCENRIERFRPTDYRPSLSIKSLTLARSSGVISAGWNAPAATTVEGASSSKLKSPVAGASATATWTLGQVRESAIWIRSPFSCVHT